MNAVVTGASSGIGFEIARILKEKGYKVYGLSRRGTVPEGCIGMALDVTDENSVKEVMEKIADEDGQIDVLINNAGMGISGPVEYTATADVEKIMNVNFMGQYNCAKAVLPYMRAKKSGKIVFVSSVAGPIAIPYQTFYSTSKAAVNALALGLRNEVKDFGIKVCAVMPGDAKTGFTDAREKNMDGAEVYTHYVDSVKSMEKDEINGMAPSVVANVVVKAAEKKNPKPLYTAGFTYKLLYILFKFLPARLAYFIVGKLY